MEPSRSDGGKEEEKEEEVGVMWVTAVPGASPACATLVSWHRERDEVGVGW